MLWQDQDSSGRGSGLKIIVDNNTTLFYLMINLKLLNKSWSSHLMCGERKINMEIRARPKGLIFMEKIRKSEVYEENG